MRIHIATGATGYLGSHLVFELLRAFPDDLIVCLARGTAQSPAAERLQRAVRIAARTSGALLNRREYARVSCVDINPLQADEKSAALLAAHMTTLPHDAHRLFWHLAASVNFVESEVGELSRINCGGTACCLELAHAINANEFNYVSTAYVSGDRCGEIDAELAATPPSFNNQYEASKFSAERMVIDVCAKRGMPARIFRPSIIVGHSVTRLSSSDSGIYKYADILLDFRDTLLMRESRSSVAEMRVQIPRDATLNLVPVDVCVREMLAVTRTDASFGGVYHVTSRDHCPTRYFHQVFSELTGIPVTVVEPDGDDAKLNRLDVELSRRLSHYGPYASTDKRFMRDSVLAFCDEDLQQNVHVDLDAMRGWLASYFAGRHRRSMITPEAQLFVAQSGTGAEFNAAGWFVQAIHEQDRRGVAIRAGEQSITYPELAHRIGTTAQILSEHGVKVGSRVAMMAADSIESAITMIAIMYAGGTAILINPLVQAAESINMLEQAQAVMLLADVDVAERMAETPWSQKMLTLAALAQQAQALPYADCDAALVSAHSHAFGVFTSGSTGHPKLALHAHMSIRVATDRYAAQVLDIKSSDVVFSASRLCFAFGLQNLFISLSHGATSILPPRVINTDALVQTINDNAPTILFAVPTIYQMILNRHVDAVPLVSRSLRACIAAGERLPEEIGRRWQEKFGLSILDSLGSSEVFSTYLSNIHGVHRPGTTGKLVPGFDAMLMDEADLLCKNGENGVLWIRGPSVISAYGNTPETPGDLFRNGWFCTKDVFRKDTEGYFYYLGRQSEMFKVAGQWISPTEIESVLLKHPRVLEAAVAATGDDASTTRPCAYIVAADGSLENLEDDIKQFCKRELESWKYPHFIHFVPSLPRTLTGKLRRFALAPNPSPESSLRA